MTKLSVDQALARAKTFERQGNVSQARELYETVLRAFPANQRARDGLAGLGFARVAGASSLQARVEELMGLYRAGRLRMVVEKAGRLVQEFPGADVVWNIAGAAHMGLKNLAEAEAAFRKCTELQPDSPGAYNNLGAVQKDLGKFEEAVANYNRALAIKPDYAEVYFNRGMALKALDRLDEAVESYRHAIRLRPDYAEAHSSLGIALVAQAKVEEALGSYREALRLKPDFADAHYNMGLALVAAGRLDEAVASYRQVLRIKPNHVDALCKLGGALKEQGKKGDAAKAYQDALRFDPEQVEALVGLGGLLSKKGRRDEAVELYRQALRIKPDRDKALVKKMIDQAAMCDWSEREEDYRIIAQYGAEGGKILPVTGLAFEDNPLRQKEWSEAWAMKNHRQTPRALPPRAAVRPKKLRVGFFSADFRSHPLMIVMSGVFRDYDRSTFEFCCYSHTAKNGGEKRERIRRYVDHFTDIHAMSDVEVVDLARQDGLDIAIDLTGYMEDSRSELFRYRLAPVQINCIGYPSTMSAKLFDYIVSDKIVIPAEMRDFYHEKIIHMPGSYFTYDTESRVSENINARSDLNLPDDAIVLCCLNGSRKYAPDTFDIWMRILKRVDGSVLWLFKSDDSVENNLRREAQARGVNPDRIVFAEHTPDHSAHLARYKSADLFIDTFNYTAHTTATDALWAGLPVVTKIGQQFAARAAASILAAIDLPELIAESDEAYEELIVELATNPEKLAAIREKLARNRLTTPLFDNDRYIRNFEAGLRAAYDRYFEGKAPDHIWVREA